MAEQALFRQACEWAVTLRLDDIPADVRDLARAQLLSMDAAVQASVRHPTGGRRWRTAAGLIGGGWAGGAARPAVLTRGARFRGAGGPGHPRPASPGPPPP